MTLFAAIRKAEIEQSFSVYRLKYPGIHRGIHTEFTEEDRKASDWQASVVRVRRTYANH